MQPTDATVPDVLDGAGPDRLKRYLGKGDSGDDLFAESRPEGQILAVAHDKAVVAVEQGEALVDGLDRLGQPGLDGFRQFLGAGEIAVGPLQLVERALQFKRALAHLGFQHDGGLEQREGVALEIHAALDPVHQDLVDPPQLLVLMLQFGDALLLRRQSRLERSRRQAQALHRAPMATPVKVWLTCIALNCSP